MAHQLLFFFLHKHLTNIWAEDIRASDSLLTHLVAAQWAGRYKVSRATKGGLGHPQKLQKWWDVMSVGSGWTLFPQPDSQGWANRRSFAPNQHDPGSPRTGVPDSDRWGSVSRSGEAGGREGSPELGVAINPRRNSDSLGTRLSASQEEAPPGQGTRRGASVSTHFHTWTNSETSQGKQPTHLYPPSSPLLLPQSKKTRYLGRDRLPPDLFRAALGEPRAALCHARTPSCARFDLHNSLNVCNINGIKKEEEEKSLHSGTRREDALFGCEQGPSTLAQIHPPPPASISVCYCTSARRHRPEQKVMTTKR